MVAAGAWSVKEKILTGDLTIVHRFSEKPSPELALSSSSADSNIVTSDLTCDLMVPVTQCVRQSECDDDYESSSPPSYSSVVLMELPPPPYSQLQHQ